MHHAHTPQSEKNQKARAGLLRGGLVAIYVLGGGTPQSASGGLFHHRQREPEGVGKCKSEASA